MADDDFDAEAFRAFEQEGWDRLHAGYHDHWEHLTTQAVPALLDAARVGPGTSVLDVASGPGYVSGAAAARGATTQGLDLSEKMVALSRRTYPGLAFRTGDAEQLPFDDARFDAVLINFGILHFPDADRALAEAWRVLKPGGRLAFTAWAGPKGSAIGIAMAAVAREGTLDLDLPAGTPVFRFGNPDECRRVLADIGFGDVACADLMLTWTLSAPDALMASFRQATARTSGILAAQDPAVLPAIAAAMTEGCKPYVKDGRADLPMPALLVSGSKG
jgi:SAM-dependent methyltransferase